MIRCNFTDRFEIEGNKLVRIVTAVWNGKRKGCGCMDVFKEYLDGRCLVRNLAVSHYGLGYLLYSPDEPEEWSEPWINCGALKTYHTTTISERDRATIVDRCPGFRWMLDKIGHDGNQPNVSEVLGYIKAWLLWPECERLLNAGFRKLCLSSAFAKATYNEQKRVIEWCIANKAGDWSLDKIRTMIRTHCNEEEYRTMKQFHCNVGLARYFIRQAARIKRWGIWDVSRIYSDYIKMAEDIGHDINDEYWKYPKDLRKAHDKVIRENDAKKAAEQAEKFAEYTESVKQWIGKEVEKYGLKVYVPDTYEDFSSHAKELHQCLVYMDYIGKCARGECLLVFLKDKKGSVATAEIVPSGKVVQFRGIHNDNVGKREEKALDAWIHEFKPKWKREAA